MQKQSRPKNRTPSQSPQNAPASAESSAGQVEPEEAQAHGNAAAAEALQQQQAGVPSTTPVASLPFAPPGMSREGLHYRLEFLASAMGVNYRDLVHTGRPQGLQRSYQYNTAQIVRGIRRFQRQNRLPVTGQLDAATFELLER